MPKATRPAHRGLAHLLLPLFLVAACTSPEAHVRRGDEFAQRRKDAEAIREYRRALRTDPGNARAVRALGLAHYRQGEMIQAYRFLLRSLVLAPEDAALRLAVGTVYLYGGNPDAAQVEAEAILVREPGNLDALSLASGRDSSRAEARLKAAAGAAGPASPAGMALADFYVRVARRDDARRVLREITGNSPGYLPAWRRLAELAVGEGNADEALSDVKPVLEKDAADLDGITLRGRVHLTRRETAAAVADFSQVLQRDPSLSPARYYLAMARLQGGEVEQARSELRETTRLAPNFTTAVLQLANLNIQAGATDTAMAELNRFIATQPGAIQAYGLLGSLYLTRQEPAKATEAYRRIAEVAPKNPQGHHLIGVGMLALGQRAEARREFEAALTLAPGYFDPLRRLIEMAVEENRLDQALNRVKKQAVLVPNSAGVQDLLGLVHAARHEFGPAEAAFLKAIALEPRLVDASVRLAGLYANAGRTRQAQERLNAALRVDPKEPSALVLLGVIHQKRGEIAPARESYERALAVSPRFASAANNLAWLIDAEGGDPEKAVALATTAHEAAPGDPHITDTLGWMLFKVGLYQRAVALLRESAAKLPGNAAVQYHLGMASQKTGDLRGARLALSRAVASSEKFPGKEEARRALEAMK